MDSDRKEQRPKRVALLYASGGVDAVKAEYQRRSLTVAEIYTRRKAREHS